jgi:hypothetical protein
MDKKRESEIHAKRRALVKKMEQTLQLAGDKKVEKASEASEKEVGVVAKATTDNGTTIDPEPAQNIGTAAQNIGTPEEVVVKPKKIMPKSPGRPRKSELQKRADKEARIKAAAEAKKAGDPIVFGFCEIPPEWPTLPANSSLASDIQWVQSNRLRVTEETPEGTKVDLGKSISPAPSWSAIGWLETSIRSYSKYCEITARATQSVEDGNAAIRREKATLEAIRTMLGEMTS